MAEIPMNRDLGSPHRIALELARTIAGDEAKPMDQRTRKYWLTLFHNCRRVVLDGVDPEGFLPKP